MEHPQSSSPTRAKGGLGWGTRTLPADSNLCNSNSKKVIYKVDSNSLKFYDVPVIKAA